MKFEIMELRRALEERRGLGGGARAVTGAAKRLHVSFSRTLAPAIAAKQIATVPWGKEERITPGEIARVLREGFGGKKRRSRKVRPAVATPSIAHARKYSYEAALQSA